MISLNVFESEIAGSWAMLSKQKGSPGKNPKDAAQRAFDLFTRTKDAPLDFIMLGPDRIRDEESIKSNFGLVNAVEKTSKKKQAQEESGAILGSAYWSTLINDAFIFGAVGGHKDVLLLMDKLPTAQQLWDSEKRTFTTMGRELFILELAGYHRAEMTQKHDILAFTPGDKKSPSALTLKGIWDKIQQTKDASSLIAFLNNKC